jgi:Helicase associated domain
MENSFSLGSWVARQRRNKANLSEAQRYALERLGFDWEDRVLAKATWNKGLTYLRRYYEREGNSLVAKQYKEDGFALGQWVGSQRQKRSSLSEDQRKQLDALGFVWQTRDAAWEKGFQSLILFKEREGHCLVPQTHAENGFRLGHWVNRMRARRGALSPERIRRLGELGFIWEIR